MWKTISKFPNYEINEKAIIRKKGSLYVLSQYTVTHGYKGVTLYSLNKKKKMCSVHRLVTEAFIGPLPEGKEVNHKNGIKNDNHVANLEIVTRQQNILHYFHRNFSSIVCKFCHQSWFSRGGKALHCRRCGKRIVPKNTIYPHECKYCKRKWLGWRKDLKWRRCRYCSKPLDS